MHKLHAADHPQAARPPVAQPVLAVSGAILLALMLAGAAWAWSHYGTAIFFEMIAAGIAACF